jgi:WD40 repeat protein
MGEVTGSIQRCRSSKVSGGRVSRRAAVMRSGSGSGAGQRMILSKRWADADGYIRTHLAGHAAAAGQLDDLVTDAGFLVQAEPAPLLAVLPKTTTEQGRLAATCYRMSSNHHRHVDPIVRCRMLTVDAARFGARALHEQLNATAQRWPVRFATGGKVHATNIAVLPAQRRVNRVATGVLDDRVIAVSGSRNSIQVWDLGEQRAIGPPVVTQTFVSRDGISALALTTVGGRVVAVVGGDDDKLRLWDVQEMRQIGKTMTDQSSFGATDVAVAHVDGRSVAVTIGKHYVRLWDLTTQALIGEPLYHWGLLFTLAVTEIDGIPVAVTGNSKDIRVWDLHECRQAGDPIPVPEPVAGLAVVELEGAPVAVIGSHEGRLHRLNLRTRRPIGQPVAVGVDVSDIVPAVLDGRLVAVVHGYTREHDDLQSILRMWDLHDPRPVGSPMTGHTSEVLDVTTTVLDGRPLAVTAGGYDFTIRLWDLSEVDGPSGDPIPGHEDQVTALAVLERDGYRLAVTGGLDRTVRAWDLRTNQPLPRTLPTSYTNALALVERDGRPLAVVSAIEADTAWEPLAGHTAQLPIRSLEPRFEYSWRRVVNATAVAHLDDEPVVVCGTDDGLLIVWDPIRERLVGPPLVIGATPRALAVFASGGHLMAVVVSRETGSDDMPVRVWDLTAHHDTAALALTDTPHVAVADPDGTPLIVTSGPGGILRLTNPLDQRMVRELTTRTKHIYATTTGTQDGHPVVLAAGADHVLRTWNAHTGQLIDELQLPDTCRDIALGDRGTLVVAVEDDIIAFDTTLKATIPRITTTGWT